MRGALTKEIQAVAMKFLGRQMSTTELRLIPYAQCVMVNEQRIDPYKCSQDDRDILQLWRDAGHVEGGVSGLSITKEFWDFMCEILWLSYVVDIY